MTSLDTKLLLKLFVNSTLIRAELNAIHEKLFSIEASLYNPVDKAERKKLTKKLQDTGLKEFDKNQRRYLSEAILLLRNGGRLTKAEATQVEEYLASLLLPIRKKNKVKS